MKIMKRIYLMKRIVLSLLIVLGVFTGATAQKANMDARKLQLALFAISNLYVDSTSETKLVEDAIVGMLDKLDPHSNYMDPEETKEMTEPLQGNFDGIGIQFNMLTDTLYVIQVIPGGPSEKVGLMAGDRIVTVDDSLFVGKKVTNERAMRTLKGPKGSQVKLGIKRTGEKDLLHFNITRGDIPQNTVDAAYMVNDDIGYVKVSKFGRTSHVELLNALAQLNHKKCKGLIIDLRGNTGGYMEAAIRMVNEFLPEGKLIVYTQGRKYPRAEEFANGTGSCQKMPLVVSLRTARREAPKRMPLSPAASRISRVGVFTLPSTRTKKIRVGRKIAAARNTASPHRSIGRARSRFSVQYAPIRQQRRSVSPRFSLRASSVR